jgi:oligosaccharide reducing-end xylanase
VVPATPSDFMDISSLVCGSQGSVRTTQDFNAMAESAAAKNGWCVYLIHGIDNDGGYSPIPAATLRGSLDYLSANKDKFWVETFGNVVRYIRERDAASVAEISSAADRITLRVTGGLDHSVFDYPITVRRPLPAGWAAATVDQSSRPVEAQIVEVGSGRFIVFDVVPDGGDIVLSR